MGDKRNSHMPGMSAERSSDGDVFKKNRVVYFHGEFDENAVKSTIMSLLEYELEDHTKDILIFIDSGGGSVDSFIAIHDIIKMMRCDVATLCVGRAMSCGQMLLMSGTKGKRFITPNSRVLMHQINNRVFGSFSEMENDLSETERLQKLIEYLISQYTTVTPRQLKKLMSKDSYMTAKEALEYGIVDHIISSNSELFSKLNQ